MENTEIIVKILDGVKEYDPDKITLNMGGVDTLSWDGLHHALANTDLMIKKFAWDLEEISSNASILDVEVWFEEEVDTLWVDLTLKPKKREHKKLAKVKEVTIYDPYYKF